MEKQKNRWLILIAAILTNVSLGAGYMWSLFAGPLKEAHGWTDSISWAYSISFAMVPIAMIFFGPKVDKIGGKKIIFLAGILFGTGMILTGFITNQSLLYITYGLLTGFGIGTGYGTATATSVKWFPDKKGLAGGLTAAGFGSGSLILTPIVQPLIANVGIQTAFKIMGAVLLFIIVGCSFFMEKAPDSLTGNTKTVVATAHDKTPPEMKKESKFWVLWTIYTLATTGGMMLIGHAAGIVNEFSLGSAAVVIMMCAAANTAGRIIWGMISDKIGRYLTVIAMLISNGAGLLLLNFNTLLGATAGVIGMLLIYFSFGGFLGAFPGITAENWGTKNSSANYGWMFTAYGIAAVIGPQIATFTGYSSAFIISTIMCVVGIVLMLMFMSRNKKSAA
ncbi:OFA family MFS transporter [Peptoniphilus sp. KCTC 25270]|uniref:L-lactate MFS transporter n=1 Tax=Peptoniphilus sp. KCTC 25270 TaxID=2897414 RepID=UPI001E29F447|nr:OFA family MFS transporter [Peptoniphilus sp. KCTC 25270]MCD1147695.1 OFA family MFS transporter [Peptoniphilus sp. KCTC 25270]